METLRPGSGKTLAQKGTQWYFIADNPRNQMEKTNGDKGRYPTVESASVAKSLSLDRNVSPPEGYRWCIVIITQRYEHP